MTRFFASKTNGMFSIAYVKCTSLSGNLGTWLYIDDPGLDDCNMYS